MTDWSPDLRQTLRRAGFVDGCRSCQGAVAQGREACATHYVPVEERERFQEQQERTRNWFKVPALAERERRKRDDGHVLRLEPEDG